MSVNVQEVLASLESLGGALREVADVELAISAARTQLGAVEAEIARKRDEASSASTQVTDLTTRVDKLKAQVAALESDFDVVYKKRNQAQADLRGAQEAHDALKARFA